MRASLPQISAGFIQPHSGRDGHGRAGRQGEKEIELTPRLLAPDSLCVGARERETFISELGVGRKRQ
jgi:hypothetical protein